MTVKTLEKTFKVKTMENKRYGQVFHYDNVFGFSVPYIDGFSDLFTDAINILNELKVR